ncbi:Spy/CpxP family protein refolding chaperone [Thalassotalea aquiviva]|uniref:Spy/CpxP family protein refolding chaperone n=1 Tax=Thalassotalea aquiviva TaxID=3242415 RepID=UPI00352AF443
MTGISKRIILLFSIVSLGLSMNAMAKDPKPHRGYSQDGGFHAIIKKMNLSDAQKVQIKEIKVQTQSQLMALKKSMPVKREQFSALMMSESFDSQEFVRLQQLASEQKDKIGLLKAQSMNQIFNVLNDEQKQQLKQTMAKRSRKMHKHRGQHKARSERNGDE